jgi:hypothetical protein
VSSKEKDAVFGTAHTRARPADTLILQPEDNAMSEPVGPSKKFMQMGIIEQIIFTFKLCLFLASFGFAFPLLLSD